MPFPGFTGSFNLVLGAATGIMPSSFEKYELCFLVAFFLTHIINNFMDECGGCRTFNHSRAVALRGKFCSDKSPQNLMPLKSCIHRMVRLVYE
jgi:hypothetical protein